MSLDITPAETLLASPQADAAKPLDRPTLFVMAAACGAAVANIIYNSPLLNDFSKHFGVSSAHAGFVATASQVGYGIGLFFFVPMGDLVERRRLVLWLVWFCALLLVGTAWSPNIGTLIALQLLVGVTAVSAQILIPLAVDLSPPAQRGNTIGVLMTGLLMGILLARTISGFIGDRFGWHAVFYSAAVVMVVLGVVLRVYLPHRPATMKMSYGRLLHSMIGLARSQPKLWTASIVSALSFAGFTAFWTALSFLMHDKFGQGATEAGLFGIVGVIGALAAPLAGKLSDRRGPNFTVTLALLATAASFMLMWEWPTYAGLVIGVLLMDVGVQSIQVAEQSEVMALVPEARSRLNTLYMVARFMGGAGGSALAATMWDRYGWGGVCVACIAMQLIAMIVHLVGTRLTRRIGAA